MIVISGILPISAQDSLLLDSIKTDARDIGSVRSLLIEQNDSLLAEFYFNGREPDLPFNIKSASKSIIGLLVGIAINEGFIPSVDEPISTYFPEYFEQYPDSVKESITIKNLLTMQAGLRSTSSGNYGAWVLSDNWVEFALKQNFEEEIGGRMVYSTGSSNLLSVIITRASGLSTKKFAESYLFRPLGIRVGGWEKDPQGYYMGGNNIALTPQDLLKIGRLLLNDGKEDDRQIIPKDWITDSFRSYTTSRYNPYGYGYQWWNHTVADTRVFFAWGHGGQYIFMIPEYDAVVVITSSVTAESRLRTYKEPIFDLLEKIITSAL